MIRRERIREDLNKAKANAPTKRPSSSLKSLKSRNNWGRNLF